MKDVLFPLTGLCVLLKKSPFKGKVKRIERDEDLFYINIEAFGLLILENHYKRLLTINKVWWKDWN